MPVLEELEKFKTILNTLGDEPVILAERGKAIEDVEPPEQGLSADLSALLDTDEGVTKQPPTKQPPAKKPGATQPSAKQPPEEKPSAEKPSAEKPSAVKPSAEEPPAEFEENSADINELLQGFGDFEDTGDENVDFGLDSLDDLETDEIPETDETFDFEDAVPAPEPDETAIAQEEPESAEDEFAIPDLEDFGMADEAPEISDGVPEAGDIEEELPAEELLEPEEISKSEGITEPEEDEFYIPDMEDFNEVEEVPEVEQGEEEAEEPAVSVDDFGTEDFDTGLPGAELSGAEDEFPDIAADLGDLEDSGETGLEEKQDETGPEEPFEIPDEFPVDDFGGEDRAGDTIEAEIGEEGVTVQDEDDTLDFAIPDADIDSLPKADEFKLPDEYEVTEEITGGEGFSADGFTADGFTAEGFEDKGFKAEPFEDEVFTTESFGAEGFGLEEIKVGGAAEEGAGELEEEFAEADEEFRITDEDFASIQKTLSELPRNLKLPIEELIGEKNLGGKDLGKLLNLLIAGASAQELAGITGRLIGKKIQIPAQYTKKTGLEFEEETGSLFYLFKTKIFPVLKILIPVAAVLGLIFFLGYRFIYRPLHAESLYKKGYTEIESDRFEAADAYFSEAWKVWQKKPWYLTYAAGYIEKNQYSQAEKKYLELLKLYDDYPSPRNEVRTRRPKDALYKRAMLGYADMESSLLSDYEKAEGILDTLLGEMMYDRDGLLALADNYLRWAEEDMKKFNSAGDVLKVVTEKYGGSPDVLYRLLSLYIKTDNEPYALASMKSLRSIRKLKVDPIAFSQMAGYLIQKDRIEDVNGILSQALDTEKNVPEVFYNFAKFYQRIKNPQKEEQALTDAAKLLENIYPISKDRRKMLIDAYNRMGLLKYGQEEYVTAEDYFLKAVTYYEDQKTRGEIKPQAELGKIYANLGDLYYYISNNYEAALDLFVKSERDGNVTALLNYKKGYIYYNREDFGDSLNQLYTAEEIYPDSNNLMYAFANTLFNRNDFFAAEGYYQKLLKKLTEQLSSIDILETDRRPEHKALVENLIKTHNNLGVTRFFLSQRSDDRGKYSDALVNLAKSSELAENLGRDPEELTRPQSKNLALLNSRSIMYPGTEFEPQIYKTIPKDMDRLSF